MRGMWPVLFLVALSACGGRSEVQRYTADLEPVNGSGVSGRATLSRSGQHLTVDIAARGLTPQRIHDQQLTGGSARARCHAPRR